MDLKKSKKLLFATPYIMNSGVRFDSKNLVYLENRQFCFSRIERKR